MKITFHGLLIRIQGEILWLVNFRATDKVPVAATHIVPFHTDHELLGEEGLDLSLCFPDASQMLPFFFFAFTSLLEAREARCLLPTLLQELR